MVYIYKITVKKKRNKKKSQNIWTEEKDIDILN